MDAPSIVVTSQLPREVEDEKGDDIICILIIIEAVQRLIERRVSNDYPIEIKIETKNGSEYQIDQNHKSSNYSVDNDNLNNHLINRIKTLAHVQRKKGLILDEYQNDLGIVKGIQGFSRHRVTFYGDFDHSGTSPKKTHFWMDIRHHEEKVLIDLVNKMKEDIIHFALEDELQIEIEDIYTQKPIQLSD